MSKVGPGERASRAPRVRKCSRASWAAAATSGYWARYQASSNNPESTMIWRSRAALRRALAERRTGIASKIRLTGPPTSRCPACLSAHAAVERAAPTVYGMEIVVARARAGAKRATVAPGGATSGSAACEWGCGPAGDLAAPPNSATEFSGRRAGLPVGAAVTGRPGRSTTREPSSAYGWTTGRLRSPACAGGSRSARAPGRGRSGPSRRAPCRASRRSGRSRGRTRRGTRRCTGAWDSS